MLDERVSYIDGRHLKPEEDAYYDLPVKSEESGTLYEHCVRAISKSLQFGQHGLPLMGSGDWNDAMNRVGYLGLGESVWLAFFLYDVLTRFREIALTRDDPAFANLCSDEAAILRQKIREFGWDGIGTCEPTSITESPSDHRPMQNVRSIPSLRAGRFYPAQEIRKDQRWPWRKCIADS